MDLKAHKDLLRSQFAAQARVHAQTLKFRHAESLVPMIELAQPKASDRMLDVASGWGFVALTFAPMVQSATGVDLTPEQVALARKAAAERGASNVEFREGDAEDLPFGAGDFDLATCRFTFHHFGQPERALHEMKRVLTPGGRIVLYDFLASSDPKKAARHNEIELARDPSHVKICALKEFSALFKKCGLAEEGRITTLMMRHFDPWMSFVDPDEAAVRKVRKLLEAAVDGNAAGLGVRVRDGEISFTHTCVAWALRSR